MLAFLTALAEALPAAGKFVDAIGKHDDKASTAAAVAKDPAAPAAVKEAAANVAAKAIDDKAATEKAALVAATGQKPSTSSGPSTGMLLAGAGLLYLLTRR